MRKSASRAGLGRMQLTTLHATGRTPHGVLVQAMSTWSVETRRAPSRHCRDARVYGHTTTAVHELTTPPTPPHLGLDERSEDRCRAHAWVQPKA